MILLSLVIAAAAPSVAVLDVRAAGHVEEKAVEGLSALIASEVQARTSARVVSGADLRALVGFEKQKQLLGCADSACLSEIGGALGVDHLLATEVSRVGGTWLLSLSLVNVARAQPAGRITREVDREEELVPAARDAVGELLSALPPGVLTPEVSEASTLPSWLLVGSGVVSSAVGAVLIVDAHGAAEEARLRTAAGAADPYTLQEFRDAESSGRTRAAVGWGAVGVGVGLSLLGAVLWP